MKDTIWQLQEAKNHFSEVVNKALEEGPQTVTRHGEEIVVILSKAEYNQLLKVADKFAGILPAVTFGWD